MLFTFSETNVIIIKTKQSNGCYIKFIAFAAPSKLENEAAITPIYIAQIQKCGVWVYLSLLARTRPSKLTLTGLLI